MGAAGSRRAAGLAAPPGAPAAAAATAEAAAAAAALAAATASTAAEVAVSLALAAAADRHRLSHALVERRIVVGGLHDHRLARQADLAALVDVDDLDGHLVAFLDEVRDLAHAVGGELADVHQAVGAGHDLDESPVGLDAPHGAGVDLADLGHLGQALDHLDGAPRRRLVGRGDDHLAVVADLD